jgi:hypothetical protein
MSSTSATSSAIKCTAFARRLPEFHGAAHRFAVARPARDLDQRQDMRRVEGMAEQASLGVPRLRADFRYGEAGSTGKQQDMWWGNVVHFLEQRLLDIEALRRAFHHRFRICQRAGKAIVENQAIAACPVGQAQPFHQGPIARHHLTQAVFSADGRIMRADNVTLPQEV